MTKLPQIVLKVGREKPARFRHPWIFSGGIQTEPREGLVPGCLVEVVDQNGQFLAIGCYSPKSQIRVRLLQWNRGAIDENFWKARIRSAVERRTEFLNEHNNACRLVFSESDGLPGVVVDRFDKVLVMQLLTAGAEYWRQSILVGLREAVPDAQCIYERSDDAGRAIEGLQNRVGIVWGQCSDEYRIPIVENGVRFLVDVQGGHKTGFYIDQRESREFIRKNAKGKKLLNCFCYTGGFSLAAARGGAKDIVSIDASGPALEIARHNVGANAFDENIFQWVEGDVFELLRKFRDQKDLFDIVILDPPKFAHNAGQVQKAARGYKDLMLNAMPLIKVGGYLATFSCSGLVSEELFQKITFGAAHDAGVRMQIQNRFLQSPDHPIALTFPESLYLKGFWLQRTE